MSAIKLFEAILNTPAERNPFNPASADPNRWILEWVRNSMTSREAEIISLHFGLDGSEPKSLTEIGKERSLSSSRAHQLKNSGLRKLQARISSLQWAGKRVADFPIEELSLSLRTRNVIYNCNIRTIGELADRLDEIGERGFLKTKGMGPKMLAKIKVVLAYHGFRPAA